MKLRVSILAAFLTVTAPPAIQTAAGQVSPAQPAQSAQRPRADAGVTLRAQARLVIVDVVVTDRSHNPIHGLKATDFSLLENKATQKVLHFEEHAQQAPTPPGKAAAFPKLPPGIFTNYIPVPENTTLNVLLLDSLNTPMRDQAFLRSQLLDYAKQQKPGTSIAIFSLGTQLRLLQGFTSNPEVLREVMQHHLQRMSPLLGDAVGGGGAPEGTADQLGDLGAVLPSQVAASLTTFDNIQSSFKTQLRARYTLDAMNVLARYLANMPGRKNVIWFSGSFPINVMPDASGDASDPFAGVASAEAEYRETTNLLTRSQVSVYPVDARGLMVSPVFDASSDGSRYARSPIKMAQDESNFSASTAEEHSTMQRMADDTGGEAFFNTNGLKQAVAKAIDHGSNYYTLAYAPASAPRPGEFRKLEVKLAQGGYQLAYRRGYYADDPHKIGSALTDADPAAAPPTAPNDPAPMRRAMTHGLPGATEIIFKMRVLPTSIADEEKPATGNRLVLAQAHGPYRRLAVDYAADVRSMSMPAGEDHLHRGAIEFILLVFAADGALVNTVSNGVKLAFPEDTYRSILKTGLTAHQEVSVPVKGDYTLRVGVHDLVSDRIGVTEIPVAAVKNLPPAQPPAAPAPQPPATPAPK